MRFNQSSFVQIKKCRSSLTIALKMAEQGWSVFHVVFTMILCGTNFLFGKI